MRSRNKEEGEPIRPVTTEYAESKFRPCLRNPRKEKPVFGTFFRF